MFLFCFTKILNLAFYMTHTFDSEVSLPLLFLDGLAHGGAFSNVVDIICPPSPSPIEMNRFN